MPAILDFALDSAALDATAKARGLKMIVLHGSHARQKPPPGPDSDLDLAILGCPADRFWSCYCALSDLFPDHLVDLVRLEDADPLLRHEIMSVGHLLHGDQDEFHEYRAFAFRDFVDSADLRRLEQTLARRKLNWLKEQLDGPH
jgi:predicted nucleotidyltransferase